MLWLHLTLFFAGVSSTAALVSRNPNVPFSHSFLYGRQSGDVDETIPGLTCQNLCDVGAGCGGTLCSARVRRSFEEPVFYGVVGAHNATQDKELVRRAFPNRINNNAEAAAYHIRRHSAAPSPNGFFDGTAAPVLKMSALGTAPIAWGTPGLHGCTMLTIVSRRAVFMAHFWETYSTYGDDTVNSGNGRTQYTQRVVRAITKTPISSPYNPPEAFVSNDRVRRNHAYIAPNGDAIDYSMFNAANDNSVAYIMTPLKDGADEGSTDYKYANKINLLTNELRLRRNLGQGLGVVIHGYKRLHYNIDEDGNSVVSPGNEADFEELVNPQHAKGMALFEWDGNNEWRLFYEDKYATSGNQNMQKRSEAGNVTTAEERKE